MKIKDFIKKETWLLVLIALVIGFIFPVQGGYLKPYTSYMLMILMFISCLNMDFKKIFEYKNYSKRILILLTINLLSPLIILFLKPFLSEDLFIGLILASISSCGMSVVFFSHIYKGSAFEALVISSISNILTPITIPLLMYLFTNISIKISAFDMFITISKLVIIPLMLAELIKILKLNNPIEKYSDNISLILLFLLIIGVISPVQQIVLSNIKESLVLVGIIIFLVIINTLVGYFIGSNYKEKIAYSISSSYKNYTLSTVIALSLFNPIIALPSIIYAIVNNVLLIPFQLIFVKKEKK